LGISWKEVGTRDQSTCEGISVIIIKNGRRCNFDLEVDLDDNILFPEHNKCDTIMDITAITK